MLQPFENKEIAIPADQTGFNTGIWLEAGKRYVFTANGAWLDKNIESGPEGFEKWYMSPFKFLRRHPEYPWLSLIGKVYGTNAFLIGRHSEYSPPVSGPLICYANDALGWYHNNQGQVLLSVYLSK